MQCRAGEGPASREMEAGSLSGSSFRFFAGQMVWQPGELARQIQKDVW
jgi:hypothetical protein